MDPKERLARDLAEGRFTRLRRQFFAASLRPPTLVWEPDAATLGDPRLTELLDLWMARRGPDGLPPPDFVAEALRGPLAERLTVVDVLNGGQELRYRLSTPGAEIERPIVDIHPHKLIRLSLIQIASILKGVVECFFAMRQPVLDALVQKSVDLAEVLLPQVFSQGIGAQGERESRIFKPPLA